MAINRKVLVLALLLLAQADAVCKWFGRLHPITPSVAGDVAQQATQFGPDDLDDSPPPPLFVKSYTFGRDFVTRVVFSNNVEIWLAESFTDISDELREMHEQGKPVSLALFVSLATSPDRIVSTEAYGHKRIAPPVRLDVALLDWLLIA